MLARLVALVLIAAPTVAAQGYVVTHVRGDVVRSGTRVSTGDRLSDRDALQFHSADALVVVVSPRGQAVLRPRSPDRRSGRRRAVALYVRDLVAPVRDVHHASARTATPGAGFRTPREMREAIGPDAWVLLETQVLHVPFAIVGDRVVVRYTAEGAVAERPLAVVDGHLLLDRASMGPACPDSDASRSRARLVLVPEQGPERPLTDGVRFLCPDPALVARSLRSVWEGTGAEADDRLPQAAAFVATAYGPTDAKSLEAWVATLSRAAPHDDR